MSEPIRLSASIALGNRAVASTAPFTFDIFFVGMLVHSIVSIWYAVVLGMIIRKLKVPAAVAVGAAFGLAIYFLHFYGLTGLYPWVANARGWIPVLGHVAFGMSAAWVYSRLDMRQLAREAKFVLRR